MKIIDECFQEIDFIVGHFCSTCFSYTPAEKEFARIQKEALQIMGKVGGPAMTLDQMDKKPFSFGSGRPDDPNTYFHYTITHGGFKKRITKDGIDTNILANNTLVFIYHVWEDRYRSLIAEAKKVPKNQISHDTFGELRNIRRSIVHNSSRALKECEQNKILKRFNEGDYVLFSESEAYDAFKSIKDAIKELKSNK